MTTSTQTTTGSYVTSQLRSRGLSLRSVSLRLLESLLAILMICTLCLVIIRPIGTPSNPSTLGRIAAVLARSSDLSNTL